MENGVQTMKNFGDYIPIIIAVAYGLYHFSKFLGKGAPPKPKSSPPPTDPFGGAEEGDWGDLLEALGQKGKPKNSAPLPPPVPQHRVEPVLPKVRTQTPPPAPRSIPEIRRQLPPELPSPPMPELQVFYQPSIAEATELKFKNFDSENAREAKPAPGLSSPVLPGLHADRFRKFLADRERLREAVVLNEILSKPLALR